jgi:hypothetical protein
MELTILSTVFDPSRNQDYALFVRIFDNRLSWLLADCRNSLLVGLGDTGILPAGVAKEHISALPLPDVVSRRIMTDGFPAVLVPDALFRKGDAAGFYHFCATAEPGSVILSDTIPQLEATNLFPLSAKTGKLIHDVQHASPVTHVSSIFLQSLAMMKNVDDMPVIGVYYRSGMLYICVFRSNKLLLSNSFAVKTDRDIQYWVCRICDQNGFAATNTRLCLHSPGQLPGQTFTMLKDQFALTSMLPFPATLKKAFELEPIDIQPFMDLIYFFMLCE